MRPPTAVGGPKPKPGEIGNKSVVHDKKIVGGKTEQEGEKKEGEEEHNGEKVETKPTTTAGHGVKSPAVTKVKPAPPTDKKTAPPPSSVKKGGKSPAVDPKKKELEIKTEEKKEEPVVAEHSDEAIA